MVISVRRVLTTALRAVLGETIRQLRSPNRGSSRAIFAPRCWFLRSAFSRDRSCVPLALWLCPWPSFLFHLFHSFYAPYCLFSLSFSRVASAKPARRAIDLKCQNWSLRRSVLLKSGTSIILLCAPVPKFGALRQDVQTAFWKGDLSLLHFVGTSV